MQKMLYCEVRKMMKVILHGTVFISLILGCLGIWSGQLYAASELIDLSEFRLVNLPASVPIGKKRLQVGIQHNFGGANAVIMALRAEYGLTDRIQISGTHATHFARIRNSQKEAESEISNPEFDLLVQLLKLNQSTNISLLASGGYFNSSVIFDKKETNRQFGSAHLALMALQKIRRAGIQFVPQAWYNTQDRELFLSVGIGAGISLTENLRFAGDIAPLLKSPEKAKIPWGVAVQFHLGSSPHTVSLFLSNTASQTVGLSFPGQDEVRFGFVWANRFVF